MARLTPRQREIFWICFGIAAVDGFDTLVIAFVAPEILADWRLSSIALGRIFSAGLLGALVGSTIAGVIADRVNKKSVLLFSVALFAGFTLACAIAPNELVLLILRLIAGLGLGGAIPTITALISETAPPENRSSIVTRMFLGFPLGAVGGGLLCSVMVGALGWRSAFWFGGILAALFVPIVWKRISQPSTEAKNPMQRSLRHAIGAPLAGGRALAALSLWGSAFMVLLVSYFLINWMPTILSRVGLAGEHAILGGVLLNLGGVIGALAMGRALDRFGPFLTVASSLCAGAILLVGFGQLIDSRLLVAPLIFLVGFFVIGSQLNLPAMAVNLFPSHVKATGVGTTMTVGRIGSIAGPYVGGLLLENEFGWTLLFKMAALATLLSGAFAWFSWAASGNIEK